jgi:hypothetical protein
VCKRPFTRVHFFYDSMCGPCAELNWTKRNQTADLRGRVALVTGARVKIGYHAAIMLLRAGARVIVTTPGAHPAVPDAGLGLPPLPQLPHCSRLQSGLPEFQDGRRSASGPAAGTSAGLLIDFRVSLSRTF